MILLASGKVLKSQLIFNCDHQMTALFHMTQHDLQKIFIGCFRGDIGCPIFKHTDQTYEIIVCRKLRLDILKVSHMDRDIILILVSPGIDMASSG